jgi:isopentenyl diphosphate isomerase/L-lactate dehydrogenase-like FMN-dependent dehydrogenase
LWRRSPLYGQAFGQDAAKGLTDPADALNVMDFEAVAKKLLPPAHLRFMLAGTDDEDTLAANREGQTVPVVAAAAGGLQQREHERTELLGQTLETPIYMCPVASHRMYKRRQVAVARAAKARGTEIMLSTSTSTAIEEVARERSKPVMYQLYTGQRWEITEKLVKRAGRARR